MRRIRERVKEDKAASFTIEFLILILLVFIFVVTVIDLMMYFNSRSLLYSAAGNGARLVALLGGSENNSISDQYSVIKMTDECVAMRGNVNITNNVACTVVEELLGQNLTIQVRLNSVDCGPPRTSGIGDRTYCEIRYDYLGMPGSGLSLARLARESFVVKATAESEVVNR